MAMDKPKKIKSLLKEIVDFVNEDNPKKVVRMGKSIRNQALELGFGYSGEMGWLLTQPFGTVRPDDVKSSEEYAPLMRDQARYHLLNMVDREEITGLKAELSFNPESNDFMVRFDDEHMEGDGFFRMIAYLMFFVGASNFRQCPGCEEFFIVIGKYRKEVCGNNCRVKKCRDKGGKK